MTAFIKRTSLCLHRAVPKALKTAWWIIKMTVPISLAVTLLHHLGVLHVIAEYLNPVFRVMGLPGESALVFISSVLLNIYAAIAVIGTLALNMREITILALMCLISHNLIVETAIQKRTGSSAGRIVATRLISSFIAALFLNWVLPADLASVTGVLKETGSSLPLDRLLLSWAEGSLLLSVKIILIVWGLMFLHEFFDEFGLLKYPVKILAPWMRFMGLSESTSFQWFVAYVIGLTYGAAIMFEEVDSGRLPLKDANFLNQHLAVSHSQLEDTLLFVSIGVGVLWITVPRLVIALAVVWINRLEIRYRKRFAGKLPGEMKAGEPE